MRKRYLRYYIEISGTVCSRCLCILNSLILDWLNTSWSSGFLWWKSDRKISSWWSWCENSDYIRQISFQMGSIDSWDHLCWSGKSPTLFTWLHWLQIVPFALGAMCADIWIVRETNGICAAYASLLACCPSCMIPFLHDAQRDSWHYLMTNDDSWFFLDILPRCL
jgi:hypothetical protein